jgi:hypothetical protein
MQINALNFNDLDLFGKDYYLSDCLASMLYIVSRSRLDFNVNVNILL